MPHKIIGDPFEGYGARTNPFLPNFGARPTLFKSSWSKPHPFERISLFWNAFGPRPTPFKGPFQCVTLGIVSKGTKPSCLWMLPFGPWVLPFGPRGFPMDVLHLPFAACILTCGPWILPSNHWFWPTVLVHIKAQQKVWDSSNMCKKWKKGTSV